MPFNRLKRGNPSVCFSIGETFTSWQASRLCRLFPANSEHCALLFGHRLLFSFVTDVLVEQPLTGAFGFLFRGDPCTVDGDQHVLKGFANTVPFSFFFGGWLARILLPGLTTQTNKLFDFARSYTAAK